MSALVVGLAALALPLSVAAAQGQKTFPIGRNCGTDAAYIMLRRQSHNVTYDAVRAVTDTDRDGASSVADLVRALSQWGMCVRAEQRAFPPSAPCILHLRRDLRGTPVQHFAYAEPARNGQYLVFYVPSGVYRMSRAEVEDLWDGIVIVADETPSRHMLFLGAVLVAMGALALVARRRRHA
jgi:ABC-type bacteriocin/lantibiotic exporter with double-glycine peptidase domain